MAKRDSDMLHPVTSTFSERQKVIRFVRRHRSLYDPTHPLYMDRSTNDKLWVELGTQLQIGVLRVRRIWKNLRDSYRTQIRKNVASYKSYGQVLRKKWVFFDEMSFMRPHMNWPEVPMDHPAFLANLQETKEDEAPTAQTAQIKLEPENMPESPDSSEESMTSSPGHSKGPQTRALDLRLFESPSEESSENMESLDQSEDTAGDIDVTIPMDEGENEKLQTTEPQTQSHPSGDNSNLNTMFRTLGTVHPLQQRSFASSENTGRPAITLKTLNNGSLPRYEPCAPVMPVGFTDPEMAYGMHVAAMLRSFDPRLKQLAKIKIENLLYDVQFGEDRDTQLQSAH